MMDLRERMVRIETKLDTQTEKNTSLTETADAHDARISALEEKATSLSSSLTTMSWVGAFVVSILTFFQERITAIFH